MRQENKASTSSCYAHENSKELNPGQNRNFITCCTDWRSTAYGNMHDYKLLPQSRWDLCSSGILHCVQW